MKKFIVTTLILILALFIFPLSSFAGNGNGNGAYLDKTEDPPQYIEDLVFDFRDGLEITLPVAEDDFRTFFLKCAEVQAEGREILVITPSYRYNYNARLETGHIYAIEPESMPKNYTTCLQLQFGDTETDPILPPLLDWIFDNADIVVSFESASLNEHFIIVDPDALGVPEDVDLFFKVNGAQLIEDHYEAVDGMPFDLKLKLKNGEVQFPKPQL